MRAVDCGNILNKKQIITFAVTARYIASSGAFLSTNITNHNSAVIQLQTPFLKIYSKHPSLFHRPVPAAECIMITRDFTCDLFADWWGDWWSDWWSDWWGDLFFCQRKTYFKCIARAVIVVLRLRMSLKSCKLPFFKGLDMLCLLHSKRLF